MRFRDLGTRVGEIRALRCSSAAPRAERLPVCLCDDPRNSGQDLLVATAQLQNAPSSGSGGGEDGPDRDQVGRRLVIRSAGRFGYAADPA